VRRGYYDAEDAQARFGVALDAKSEPDPVATGRLRAKRVAAS